MPHASPCSHWMKFLVGMRSAPTVPAPRRIPRQRPHDNAEISAEDEQNFPRIEIFRELVPGQCRLTQFRLHAG